MHELGRREAGTCNVTSSVPQPPRGAGCSMFHTLGHCANTSRARDRCIMWLHMTFWSHPCVAIPANLFKRSHGCAGFAKHAQVSQESGPSAQPCQAPQLVRGCSSYTKLLVIRARHGVRVTHPQAGGRGTRDAHGRAGRRLTPSRSPTTQLAVRSRLLLGYTIAYAHQPCTWPCLRSLHLAGARIP